MLRQYFKCFMKHAVLVTGLFGLLAGSTVAIATEPFTVIPTKIGGTKGPFTATFIDFSYMAVIDQQTTGDSTCTSANPCNFQERGAGFFGSFRHPGLDSAPIDSGLGSDKFTEWNLYAVFSGAGTSIDNKSGLFSVFNAFSLEIWADPQQDTTIEAGITNNNDDDKLVASSTSFGQGEAHIFPGLIGGDYNTLVRIADDNAVGFFSSTGGPFDTGITIADFNAVITQVSGITDGTFTGGTLIGTGNVSFNAVEPEPTINIEKATNGVDADDPNAGDAPQVIPGGPVTWTYVVTNTGNEPLTDVVVTDNQLDPISCPKMMLAPGESMSCTASGLAEELNNTAFTTVPGTCGSIPDTPMYENIGQVTGDGANTGIFVKDVDPSHYCNPQEPAIDIEKATNGVDADFPNKGDAPQVIPGGSVTWTYVVTNTGNMILYNVMVNDDQIGSVNCPKMTLALGESMSCSAAGIAEDLNNTNITTVLGTCGGFPNTPMYKNMGHATGESITDEPVEDKDPSHYCNPSKPAIELEKLTNGFDADQHDESSTSTGKPTVPSISAGDMVTWTYRVTNTGNTVLDPVTVSDDAGTPEDMSDDFCTSDSCTVKITCPLTVLNPGQTMDCTAERLAHNLSIFTPVVAGTCGSVPSKLYENRAVATGTPPSGSDVSDLDPSHYCNPGVCNLEVNKTCQVIPPPQADVGSGSCQKPIDVLKLEYAGGPAITAVSWYAGDMSKGNLIRSATALEVASLNSKGVLGFNGFEDNNSPNDVQMVTTLENGSAVTSEFHLSCSDQDMNGPEDCGRVIGDGKNNDLPAASNIWKFRGTGRLGDGAGISCPLPPADPVFPTASACEFMPPQSAASCSDIKGITALTMVWQGLDDTNIQVAGGESISGINHGDRVTFSTPNKDTLVTISGSVDGTSKFHVSCSDQEMNGPEDCGISQGNGKGNDTSLNNQWTFEGMTGQKGVIDCAAVEGRSGAEVRYGIEVKNLNDQPVNVTIIDPTLNLNQPETIAAKTKFLLQTAPTLIVPDGSNEFVNVVKVSGQTSGGASCDASATARVTRKPPPPLPVSCSDIKDITAVSVVWNGSEVVDVTTESGEVFLNVQPGDQITFQEAGAGNDIELNLSGDTINAQSRFHVSCSDHKMNGSEDCGSSQGDGKDNDLKFNNDWLFDGMIGEKGAFACNLPNTGVVDPEASGSK